MQRIVAVIVLLLFLSLLFPFVSIFCFYSDLRNSLLLHSLTFSNSVMAPRILWTRTKRTLEQDHRQDSNHEDGIQGMCHDENFAGSPTKADSAFHSRQTDRQIQSRRQKQLSQQVANNQSLKTGGFKNSNAKRYEHRDKRVRSGKKNSATIENESLFTDASFDVCNTSTRQERLNIRRKVLLRVKHFTKEQEEFQL